MNTPNKPVCVIIGVGPGNGAAFAKKFTENGYQVALLARQTDYTAALSETLADSRYYACDAIVPDSIVETFANINQEMGNVDVLIYNAGSGSWKNMEELTIAEFSQSWQINALGSFVATRQIMSGMKKNARGCIIFIGATASRRGNIFTAGFAGAKAAQKSLAESLARYLGPFGIHVALLIIDGIVDTPNVRLSMPDKSADFFIKPDDIADTLLAIVNQKPSAWSFETEVRPFGEKW